VPRHVGIVGCSPPGAALCYEVISNELSALARSSSIDLEVSMHSHAFTEYMRYIEGNDWASVSRLMLSSGNKLADVGAEFLVAPCNTIHKVFDLVTAESPLPWLHIAAEVAVECWRRGFKRLALLGTSLIMEGDIYSSQFERLGIEYRIPSRDECKRLDQFIFEEMVQGNFTIEAQRYVTDLIGELRSRGCDAAGLCCTELPILLAHADPPLPVLDSTRCLAEAAINRIRESLPSITSSRCVGANMDVQVGEP